MKGLCLACKEEMKTKIQDDRAALSQQESGDSGVVKIFRLSKTSCVVGEVNYSCNVNIVENVVHREVVIMKVINSLESFFVMTWRCLLRPQCPVIR